MTAVHRPSRARSCRRTPRASSRIKINPEKIGALIGPGGKMIRSIIEETGAKIDVEDDGTRVHRLHRRRERADAPSR